MEDGQTSAPAPAPPDQPPARALRGRVSIATAFTLIFGLLVAVTAAAVLGIGLWSGRRNTLELLSQREQLAIDLVVQRLKRHLDPVVAANAYLAGLVNGGDVDPEDTAQLVEFMAGAIAATPQVSGMAYVTPAYRVVRVERRKPGPGFNIRVSDWSGNPQVAASMEEARNASRPYWGRLVWSPTAHVTLLNRRAPLRVHGRFVGFLVSTVSLAEISRFLATETDNPTVVRNFVLYGTDHVLAHPNMASGRYRRSDREPIPGLDQIGDPVLANFWNMAVRRPSPIPPTLNMDGFTAALPSGSYAVFYLILDGYAAQPLRVGAYARMGGVGGAGVELQRLLYAAVAGGGILVVAVLLALLFGWRLAGPIRALAAAAERVRALEFSDGTRLARSRLTELDEAAGSFNAMIAGLRWFQTYVPRTLVRSLMSSPDEAAAVESADREVTVMFTDIRSFTSRAETMTAAETAAFLNAHFSLIAACVEREDGTIDKYIGDSVMAFWGAPRRTEDHAIRACHAALAIRAALARDNLARAGRGEQPLHMGIGIHCGRVIAGNIGAPGRVNYTLVGDSVNLAQRLEELSKNLARDQDEPVSILISGEVARRLAAGFTVEPCGIHTIRGREATVDVYRLA